MSLRFKFRHAATTLLVAGTLFCSASAFADTITIGSGMAGTTVNYDNSAANAPQNTGVATTGTATAVQLGYASPIAGTSYITYSGAQANGGVTVYTTQFTGNFLGGFGTLSLAADDSVTAFLNGVWIGSTGGTSWNTIVGPLSYTSGLINGTNVLKFYVTNANGTTQNGGPTNLDFKFTASAVAPTPEPSSLALLGTGVLGVAGVMRKKLFS